MRVILLLISSLVLISCNKNHDEEYNMPKAPIAEKIRYTYTIFGQQIVDNYHWLRDQKWPDVKDQKILNYINEENKYSEHFFNNNQQLKEKIFHELKGRIKLSDQSVPIKKDNFYYYNKTHEDKEYSVYCRRIGSLENTEEEILDVNKLAEGKKFTKINSIAVSPNHNLLAYSVDFLGDEHYKIYIKNLETGEILSDTINNVIGDIVWHENLPGFFYTPVNENWRRDKVLFHKLGEPVGNDILVYQEKDHLNQLSVNKTASKEYIFINSSSHDSNQIHYFSMRSNEFDLKLFKARQDKVLYTLDHCNEFFYIHTNDQGPNFRLAKTNVENIDQENWVDVLPYSKTKYLSSFSLSKSHFIANYTVNALPLIEIYEIENLVKDVVSFPDAAFTASAFVSNFNENIIMASYSSLKQPDTVYRYNTEEKKLEVLKITEIPSGFNSEEYNVERVWVDNSGVKVPLTIFYKKSLFKKDGTNPLYLYGYGSYGYSVPPSFRNTAVTLADRGVVFAIAHIRGGDDLGYEWYESSKFLGKKNTFNDFISSANFLINENYTSKGNIVISGGSAGGLLIGYCLNEAPDLFKAAIAHVPFVDVLNTMLDESLPLTPGEFKEWGNPKEKKYFDYIQSYSPYDNVKRQNYPHIFVTAGLTDPRVTYWEAAKWVAKLREHKTDNNIILLKVNMDAGHAGASGRFDYLKEVSEDYVFVFSMFGIKE